MSCPGEIAYGNQFTEYAVFEVGRGGEHDGFFGTQAYEHLNSEAVNQELW